MTPGTAFLKAKGVSFSEHTYEYVEHGGTAVPAQALGVPEHAIVKTLVMEDEARKPQILLMHGDRKVSTRNLARQAGRKSIEPCKPEVAQAHGRGRVGRREQRFHVRLRQRLREARRALGRIELERRVDLDAPLAQAVLVEPLQRRDAPRGTRGTAFS